MRRVRITAAIAGAVLLFLAACDGQETPDQPDSVADENGSGEVEDPVTAARVGVASTSLGDILVDGDGLTLYMFDADEQGPSTCYDECAENWPAYVVDPAAIADEGVDAMTLATRARDDGTRQVTYHGWPLYYYAGDAEPGDVNGQGVNGVWWVLDASGEPVRD